MYVATEHPPRPFMRCRARSGPTYETSDAESGLQVPIDRYTKRAALGPRPEPVSGQMWLISTRSPQFLHHSRSSLGSSGTGRQE